MYVLLSQKKDLRAGIALGAKKDINTVKYKEKHVKARMVLGLFLALSLVLLVACGGSTASSHTSSAPSGVPEVHITLTDTSITSSLTTFTAARPYYFIVTNKGHAPHNFIIRQQVQGPALNPQKDKGILYQITSSQLQPGATQSFTFQFPLSAPQSHFQFASGILTQTGATILLPIEVQ